MGNPSRDIQHNLFPTYLVSDVIAHIYAGALCVITVSRCQFIEGKKKTFSPPGSPLFVPVIFFFRKNIFASIQIVSTRGICWHLGIFILYYDYYSLY